MHITHPALKILKLALNHKEELKSLPSDLRERVNKILYTRK